MQEKSSILEHILTLKYHIRFYIYKISELFILNVWTVSSQLTVQICLRVVAAVVCSLGTHDILHRFLHADVEILLPRSLSILKLLYLVHYLRTLLLLIFE